ncbi:MAG: DUF4129 domain-containing protein [Actinobacteria bacterium]|nr:DUF4129 domain-containing protein [Actinomycetota bacterium]
MDGARRRRAGLVVACAAGFVLLLAAASAGPVQLWHAPPPADPVVSEPEPVAPEAAPEPPPPPSIHFDVIDNDILEVIATVVALLIGGAIAYAVIGVLVGWIRGRAGREREAELADGVVEVLPELVAPVVLDVDAQLSALAQGSPRNAIVACWLRLEDDVAAAGLPRRRSETSAEFTTRVLASYSLDPGPIAELAALYREARFSRHELGQADRDRALVALRRVHAALAPVRTSHQVEA